MQEGPVGTCYRGAPISSAVESRLGISAVGRWRAHVSPIDTALAASTSRVKVSLLQFHTLGECSQDQKLERFPVCEAPSRIARSEVTDLAGGAFQTVLMGVSSMAMRLDPFEYIDQNIVCKCLSFRRVTVLDIGTFYPYLRVRYTCECFAYHYVATLVYTRKVI